VSVPPPARMPSPSVASDASVVRPGAHLRTPGLVLIGLWSALLASAVVLWVRVAFFPSGTDDAHGFIVLVGAPFVLVALGLLWWAWRSVRALREWRREGWTILLVLGGVAVAQTVMTAPAVVGALGGSSGSGPSANASTGPPAGIVPAMLAAIVLGLTSVIVAVLARRSWPPTDPAADAADAATDEP